MAERPTVPPRSASHTVFIRAAANSESVKNQPPPTQLHHQVKPLRATNLNEKSVQPYKNPKAENHLPPLMDAATSGRMPAKKRLVRLKANNIGGAGSRLNSSHYGVPVTS